MWKKMKAKKLKNSIEKELIRKVKECKEHMNKWNDIPLSMQLGSLAKIWEPDCEEDETMVEEFAIKLQLIKNNPQAIKDFVTQNN